MSERTWAEGVCANCRKTGPVADGGDVSPKRAGDLFCSYCTSMLCEKCGQCREDRASAYNEANERRLCASCAPW